MFFVFFVAKRKKGTSDVRNRRKQKNNSQPLNFSPSASPPRHSPPPHQRLCQRDLNLGNSVRNQRRES